MTERLGLFWLNGLDYYDLTAWSIMCVSLFHCCSFCVCVCVFVDLLYILFHQNGNVFTIYQRNTITRQGSLLRGHTFLKKWGY